MDSDSTLVNNSSASGRSSNTFAVGKVLDNKYEILALLGRGGMGSVYRAKHLLLNIEVALKTLDYEHIGDISSSRRFETEAKAAFTLEHPGLVKVHDYGVLEEGYPFFVMELVNGQTLQALIRDRGQLSLEEVSLVFPQICFSLAHAHERQVVHRDIKPANIMLVDDVALSEEGSVKILDFGIAKIVGSERGEMQTLTQTGEIFGSPSYMSPEQCSGAAVDQRSDVYSVGCVLFEALTGTPPFAGVNALRTMMLHVNDTAPLLREAALGREFPDALEQVVSKMLAKEPSQRYSDISLAGRDIFVACGGSETEFKVSTTQSKNAGQNRSVAQNEKITLTYVQLCSTIFATVIVSVLCTLTLDRYTYIFRPTSTPKAPPAKEAAANLSSTHIDDVPAIRKKFTEARASFARVQEMKAITNQSNNRQTIVFPALAVGDISFVDNGVLRQVKANGPINLPCCGVWMSVAIDLFPQLLSNGYIFEKLDRAFVRVLTIEGPDRETSEIFPNPELLALSNQLFTDLLGAATRWTELWYLHISNQDISPRMMDEIDKIGTLTRFGVNNVTYLPNSLKGHSTFKRITDLVVQDMDPREIFEAVAGSNSIKYVVIDCTLTASDIAILGTCKQLRNVEFSRSSVPDDIARAVVKLQQVEQIQTKHCALSKEAQEELSKHWKEVPVPGAAPGTSFRLQRRQ